MGDPGIARFVYRLFGVLVGPGQVMRDVNSERSGFEGGQDIGAQRITGHERVFSAFSVAGENALVGRDILVGDDFYCCEVLGKTGRGEFALLVEDVAFGDEDQTITIPRASSAAST